MTSNPIFVIRFSLRLNPDWERRVFASESNRDHWLDLRLSLFRALTLASIQRQTIPPKLIMLLMDNADADWANRQDLGDERVVPVFCKPSEIRKTVAAELIDRGITTNLTLLRCDSDDLLFPSYVKTVCNELDEMESSRNEPSVICATDGVRYDLESAQRVYYESSPFIGMRHIEQPDCQLYSFNHELVDQKFKASRLRTSDPQWIQLVHKHNVSNNFWRDHDDEEFWRLRHDREKAIAGQRIQNDSYIRACVGEHYLNVMSCIRSAAKEYENRTGLGTE